MQGQLFLEKMAKFPIVHKLEQDEQTEISISCLNLSLHRMIMIRGHDVTYLHRHSIYCL